MSDPTDLPVRRRSLLLVEDNPGDAAFVEDLLSNVQGESFVIERATRLSEALQRLPSGTFDVILLDLHLPDCSGLDTLTRVRNDARGLPIIVFTGTDDDALALACIDAGAQDYLPKAELSARPLVRAIGYAITRQREQQMNQMRQLLDRYRALSTDTQATSVTAMLAGSGAIRLRSPATFEAAVQHYNLLLEPYVVRQTPGQDAPRTEMERIVTTIGDATGGPRDLLDVHVAALDRALATFPDRHSRAVVAEARLLALEMMGLLVDYYRVGHRRRFAPGGVS